MRKHGRLDLLEIETYSVDMKRTFPVAMCIANTVNEASVNISTPDRCTVSDMEYTKDRLMFLRKHPIMSPQVV